MVGKKLERNRDHDWRDNFRHFGNLDYMVGYSGNLRIAGGYYCDYRSATGFYLLYIRNDFIMHLVDRCDNNCRQLMVDKRDWPVFHFSGRIALCMYV